jgi:hypothetical protein
MLCSLSVCLEPAAFIIVKHLKSVAFFFLFSSYHVLRRCGEWICEFADINKAAHVQLTAKWQRSDNEQDRYIAEPLLRPFRLIHLFCCASHGMFRLSASKWYPLGEISHRQPTNSTRPVIGSGWMER